MDKIDLMLDASGMKETFDFHGNKIIVSPTYISAENELFFIKKYSDIYFDPKLYKLGEDSFSLGYDYIGAEYTLDILLVDRYTNVKYDDPMIMEAVAMGLAQEVKNRLVNWYDFTNNLFESMEIAKRKNELNDSLNTVSEYIGNYIRRTIAEFDPEKLKYSLKELEDAIKNSPIKEFLTNPDKK